MRGDKQRQASDKTRKWKGNSTINSASYAPNEGDFQQSGQKITIEQVDFGRLKETKQDFVEGVKKKAKPSLESRGPGERQDSRKGS